MHLLKTGILLLSAFVLMGALVACSPVTALNALAPSDTYTRMAAVAYGPGSRQQLDVYKPVSAAPAGGWPVVVFFYGGSWNRGERGDYAFVGEALASRGILTLVHGALVADRLGEIREHRPVEHDAPCAGRLPDHTRVDRHLTRFSALATLDLLALR